MQTSKGGLKTELGREAWLCWAHCHPQERGCGAPSPGHRAHCAAVTPSSRPALGTRRSGLLINQGRAAASKARPEMGVFPEHLRAQLTLRPSGPEQTPGEAPGEWDQCWQQAFDTTSSSILGLIRLKTLSPLPCPAQGSCHLNYICKCANSS